MELHAHPLLHPVLIHACVPACCILCQPLYCPPCPAFFHAALEKARLERELDHAREHGEADRAAECVASELKRHSRRRCCCAMPTCTPAAAVATSFQVWLGVSGSAPCPVAGSLLPVPAPPFPQAGGAAGGAGDPAGAGQHQAAAHRRHGRPEQAQRRHEFQGGWVVDGVDLRWTAVDSAGCLPWAGAQSAAQGMPAPCSCVQNALDNVSNKVGVSGAAQDDKDASQLDPFRWGAGCWVLGAGCWGPASAQGADVWPGGMGMLLRAAAFQLWMPLSSSGRCLPACPG